MVYPSIEKNLEGLPPRIATAYQKALKVRNVDSNAFAVMLGRVLDEVCLDKEASGENLYQRLAYLSANGTIPQQLADMAHQLRQLRNIGAHADLGDLTPAEIPVLGDLCEAILEYVYTAPALIQRGRARLDDLKKSSKS